MADMFPAAQHLGFDYLDSGQLVATYFVPVSAPFAPDLYTAAQLEQARREGRRQISKEEREAVIGLLAEEEIITTIGIHNRPFS